jgi:1,4-dihydroxy-2-naphthoyl-CoA hydrolase
MTPDQIVDALNQNLGELAASMGVKFTSADPQHLTCEMPVEGNRQPLGMLHGGASAVLAETAGSIVAMMLAPEGKVPVGIELSCAHHRSATTGTVHCVAEPMNVGRTLATINIRITDEKERPICTARLTCLYRDPPAGMKDPRDTSTPTAS